MRLLESTLHLLRELNRKLVNICQLYTLVSCNYIQIYIPVFTIHGFRRYDGKLIIIPKVAWLRGRLFEWRSNSLATFSFFFFIPDDFFSGIIRGRKLSGENVLWTVSMSRIDCTRLVRGWRFIKESFKLPIWYRTVRQREEENLLIYVWSK